MQDLKETMIAYGADMKGAMERFLDDIELYQSCLDLFMDDPGFAQLQEALDTKNYEAAFNAAHTLKGVAGNMGLTPLFNAICDLVEPLRGYDKGTCEEKYDILMEKYAAVIQERTHLAAVLKG